MKSVKHLWLPIWELSYFSSNNLSSNLRVKVYISILGDCRWETYIPATGFHLLMGCHLGNCWNNIILILQSAVSFRVQYDRFVAILTLSFCPHHWVWRKRKILALPNTVKQRLYKEIFSWRVLMFSILAKEYLL